MLSKKYMSVDKKQCVACGACMKECVKKAINIWKGCYAVVDEKSCVGCGKCYKACPVGCISVFSREEN